MARSKLAEQLRQEDAAASHVHLDAAALHGRRLPVNAAVVRKTATN
jgi:hypothetical protein